MDTSQSEVESVSDPMMFKKLFKCTLCKKINNSRRTDARKETESVRSQGFVNSLLNFAH